jgi:hypothetical protein
VITTGTLVDLIAAGGRELRIECDDAARAEALLNGLPTVTAVTVSANGTLSVQLAPDSTETRAGVNRKLIEAGLAVSRLEPREESLEERYLSLVHEAGQA